MVLFRDAFMASAQMTVCEYKTRLFRGGGEVPGGASNAHHDGGLRFSVGLQEAQLCDRWTHSQFFLIFPACFCRK